MRASALSFSLLLLAAIAIASDSDNGWQKARVVKSYTYYEYEDCYFTVPCSRPAFDVVTDDRALSIRGATGRAKPHEDDIHIGDTVWVKFDHGFVHLMPENRKKNWLMRVGTVEPLSNADPDPTSLPANVHPSTQTTLPRTATPSAAHPQISSNAALLGVEVTNWTDGGQAGVKIKEILPDSPAETAGLHVGDVIVSINGTRVRSAVDFEAASANKLPGEKITVVTMFHTNLGWMPGAEKVLILKGKGSTDSQQLPDVQRR